MTSWSLQHSPKSVSSHLVSIPNHIRVRLSALNPFSQIITDHLLCPPLTLWHGHTMVAVFHALLYSKVHKAPRWNRKFQMVGLRNQEEPWGLLDGHPLSGQQLQFRFKCSALAQYGLELQFCMSCIRSVKCRNVYQHMQHDQHLETVVLNSNYVDSIVIWRYLQGFSLPTVTNRASDLPSWSRNSVASLWSACSLWQFPPAGKRREGKRWLCWMG